MQTDVLLMVGGHFMFVNAAVIDASPVRTTVLLELTGKAKLITILFTPGVIKVSYNTIFLRIILLLKAILVLDALLNSMNMVFQLDRINTPRVDMNIGLGIIVWIQGDCN